MMNRVSWTVIALLLGGPTAYIGYQFMNDPMDTRRANLANQLKDIVPAHLEYVTDSDVQFEALRAQIVGKPALWKELVPPPPTPPPRVMPPNLQRKLAGVVVTRTSIGQGDEVKVLIKSAGNPRGAFMGTGETVNGVEILNIEKTNVMFGITKDGVQYTYRLRRR